MKIDEKTLELLEIREKVLVEMLNDTKNLYNRDRITGRIEELREILKIVTRL